MEVILIDKIKNLGDIGDLVEVRCGYARNYLIPYQKAKFATEENRLEIEQRRAEYEKQVSEERAAAKQLGDKLEDLELSLVVQAMEDGQLYGSVSAAEIADMIVQKCGVEIKKQDINFPQGQIRTIGSHPVIFSLHSDVQIQTQLQVIAAQSSGDKNNTKQQQPKNDSSQQSAEQPETGSD
ncbi:MAG: 50S ribosomal protein L9 [Chromatiales bacterium]|nr:50S ribosomal protein L9 [Chromatiales bacterium]